MPRDLLVKVTCLCYFVLGLEREWLLTAPLRVHLVTLARVAVDLQVINNRYNHTHANTHAITNTHTHLAA